MSTTFHVSAVRTSEGFGLDELYLSIRFSGNSPSSIIPDRLPIKVSIHIPDEFLDQLSPSLDILDRNALCIEQNSRSYPRHLHVQYFPFFPLPPTFNPYQTDSWHLLARQIEAHLVQAEDEGQPAYLLAREFFWMAFVAAFPTFPYGHWPIWHPRICMAGDFVAYWIADHNSGELTPDSLLRLHGFIWDEFKMLADFSLPFDIRPVDIPLH